MAAREPWALAGKLYSFRATPDDLDRFGARHLVWGAMLTWIVGIGRFWDDPEATFLQHSGAGSLLYVLGLASVLWLLLAMLRLRGPLFLKLLTFVCWTSPLGLLYAIPVELIWGDAAALNLNIAFLSVVAAGRLLLALFYLPRLARLSWFAADTALLLLISSTVSTLCIEHMMSRMFAMMGGLRETPMILSGADVADRIWRRVEEVALPSTGILALVFLFLVVRSWSRRSPQGVPRP